ncbi:MAG: glycosyltransferase family 39 protein [Vicinamibacterales bacterium]
MRRSAFVVALLAAFAVALTLRTLWLRSDPPVMDPVGIVWHDEGAWTHNARNRALWGTWRTDEWNPVFLTPVFTALEYASFESFGVGTWQARVVPVASGLLALGALVAGLLSLAGRRAALTGAILLGTSYEFVMWNRAALMESTLTALLVCAWAAYAAGEKRQSWGLVAGLAATLAWFTKASAAFFLAALTLDSLMTLARAHRNRPSARGDAREAAETVIVLPPMTPPQLAYNTLAALGLSVLIIGLLFVLPHWREYEFYNWQMSVTRKPGYSLKDFQDRISWLPLVHGAFSRMVLVTVCGCAGLLAVLHRWRHRAAGERLLVLWIALGLLELVVHDSGNERRYVMLIPALVALASMFLTRASTGASVGHPVASSGGAAARGLAVFVPVLAVGYLVAGTLMRPLFLADIESGMMRTVVRLSAAAAVVVALAAVRWRRTLAHALETWQAPPALLAAVVVITVGWNGAEYITWVRHRAQTNFEASVALGRVLPAETLVQGKLANGLSLENRIRPLFVGNGFGNYADRLRRDDARYILTYDLPRIGYESSDGSGLIQGILDRYPRHRSVAAFVVDETPEPDRAVLIDKSPDSPQPHARD